MERGKKKDKNNPPVSQTDMTKILFFLLDKG
jgi:hypothetical protein